MKNKYYFLKKAHDKEIEDWGNYWMDNDELDDFYMRYYGNYDDIEYNYINSLELDYENTITYIQKFRRNTIYKHITGRFIDMDSFYSKQKQRELKLDYLFGNKRKNNKPTFADLLK